MNLEQLHIAEAVVVGIGAALIMDLWNLFLQRAFNIASLNFCLVGRWLSHMTDGTFTHARIGNAAKRPAECVIGWTAHFLIGATFALLLVVATSGAWLEQPSFLPALLVGVGTVLIPYFVVQPALGLGIASANAPHPAQARLKSLVTHTVFGLGLYLSALAWKLSPARRRLEGDDTQAGPSRMSRGRRTCLLPTTPTEWFHWADRNVDGMPTMHRWRCLRWKSTN